MIVYAKKTGKLHIGREGENLATQVIFNVSEWLSSYGEGEITLYLEQDSVLKEEILPVIEGNAVWDIVADYTSAAGEGTCQLKYTNLAGTVVKSDIYSILVTKALD